MRLARVTGRGTDGGRIRLAEAAEIAPSGAWFDSPVRLSSDEITEAVARLTPAETRRAMTDRILPIAWSPGRTMFASASPERSGIPRRIIAHAEPDMLLRALQRRNNARLKKNAVRGFDRRFPQFSARPHLSPAEVLLAVIVLLLMAVAAWQWPWLTLLAGSFVFSIFFLCIIGLRILSLLPPPYPPGPRILRLADRDLPVYSVLVPLFRETGIVDQLVAALAGLDYPHDKLDIKLILEANDLSMRRHVGALQLPDCFEIIVVPPCRPQTKPKALNYALSFARGDLVTIFDAEDIPDRGQLRIAAGAFAGAPPDIVCLQAKLSFYNAGRNWLTRQFALEYAVHFGLLLPTLASLDLPIPLGGTSNHFRTDILRAVGAWDPYNVTEDADLGMRLARFGYRSGMIPSRTREEACSGLGNWTHQRSRWLKGWLQTWLYCGASIISVINQYIKVSQLRRVISRGPIGCPSPYA